ncbi:hypothetical protein POSPLADRAFT_1136567 [Postia placenta MAD-698-R-SB12]|uniref:Uncharacterized protein n=1 Tax=Postia placenta MAD-698-R-SB12 TaxID=670580 RepID=A0A1X6NAB1_9APHY|nr:hypothetical protein POSPLADRAFT_1136567 [Postia placenta MAD-698-R-SB12]OSX65587.1 hypothetical protein POSPLADRAFT_1136567 [Postia placenta MAD-698-R-SB12]
MSSVDLQQLYLENVSSMNIMYKPGLGEFLWAVVTTPFGIPVCLGHALLRLLLPPALSSSFDTSVAKTLDLTFFGQIHVIGHLLLLILIPSVFGAAYARSQGIRRPRILLYAQMASLIIVNLVTGPLAPLFVPTIGAAIGFVGGLYADMRLDELDASQLDDSLLSPNAAAIAGWYGYALVFLTCKFLHALWVFSKEQSQPTVGLRIQTDISGVLPFDVLPLELEDVARD